MPAPTTTAAAPAPMAPAQPLVSKPNATSTHFTEEPLSRFMWHYVARSAPPTRSAKAADGEHRAANGVGEARTLLAVGSICGPPTAGAASNRARFTQI